MQKTDTPRTYCTIGLSVCLLPQQPLCVHYRFLPNDPWGQKKCYPMVLPLICNAIALARWDVSTMSCAATSTTSMPKAMLTDRTSTAQLQSLLGAFPPVPPLRHPTPSTTKTDWVLFGNLRSPIFAMSRRSDHQVEPDSQQCGAVRSSRQVFST